MKRKYFTSKHNTLFSCIGSQCEDNCCESSWNVFVNQSAYEQYEALDKETGSHLLDHMEKLSSQKQSSQYAQIQFQPNHSSCSFLTTDKWCKIHQEYGYDLLCDTCKYYPRMLKQVDDTYYETGTISCPEMARVILLSKIPFEWKPKDGHASEERAMQFYSVNQNYRKDMQETIASFLQQSTDSLPQRLQRIGIFINELYTFSNRKMGISKKMKSAKKNRRFLEGYKEEKSREYSLSHPVASHLKYGKRSGRIKIRTAISHVYTAVQTRGGHQRTREPRRIHRYVS